MRALCYIKSTFPPSTFESIWLTLFQKLWTPPNQIDITKPDLLRGILSESGLFKASEIDDVLNAAGQKEWKDKLLVSANNTFDSLSPEARDMEAVLKAKLLIQHFFRPIHKKSLIKAPSGVLGFGLEMQRARRNHSLGVIGFILCGSIWGCRGRILRSCHRVQRRGRVSCKRLAIWDEYEKEEVKLCFWRLGELCIKYSNVSRRINFDVGIGESGGSQGLTTSPCKGMARTCIRSKCRRR
jgi:hypothetical protein